MNKNKKAVVIGSGFGGLSSALMLQANGYETIIVEALDIPGGRGRVFRVKDYEFEAGPTVVTAPELLEEVYAKAGLNFDEEIELLETTPFYDLFWEDGTQMHYYGDEKLLLDEIMKISPEDVDNYSKFYDQTCKIYKKGFDELVREPFLNYFDFVKQLPNLAYLRADRSVFSLAKKYFKNDKLRQAFSFHSLLLGGNPTTTTSIYALIHALERKEGVFYVKGGTHVLIENMLDNFKKMSGEIVYNQSVVEILVDNQEIKGVKLSDGSIIETDIVVSNADITKTYLEMLPNNVKKE